MWVLLVVLSACKYQKKMSLKNKSEVWQYFSRTGNGTSACNLCSKSYKTGGGTTNLRNHLVHKHGSRLVSLKSLNKPTEDIEDTNNNNNISESSVISSSSSESSMSKRARCNETIDIDENKVS